MAARAFLMPVIESSFGTTKTSPVLGTDKFYMRLDKDDSFDSEMEPVQLPIPYGGGSNIEHDTVSDVDETKGRFNFLLYGGVYSELLLKWAINGINSGRTTPWTTTDSAGVMPVGDFASMTFYFAYLTEDGSTYKRQKALGAKCDEWVLTGTEDGEGRLWRLSGSFTAIKQQGNARDSSSDPDATEFPAPADSNYPTSPYTFGHLGSGTGTCTIGTSGGTNRAASLSSLTIRGRNIFAPNRYTSRYLTTNLWVGRQVSAEAVLRYKASPADRDTWRALSALTATFKIDNGTNSVQLAFGANNLFRPWSKRLPGAGQYMQGLSIANRWVNGSPGTDLTLTVA